MSTSFILLGAGGHAKVVLAMLQALRVTIHGVCAPELEKHNIKSWRGLSVLPEEELVSDVLDFSLANGVGQRVGDNSRQRVYEFFQQLGYVFPALVHPMTYVDPTVSLANGVQIMAGAVVQADTAIEENVLINTRASIDHDCKIDKHTHVAPGAVLCGQVVLGKRVLIAAGAVLAPSIVVQDDVIIGAGASIVRDVSSKQRILPAAMIRQT